MADLPPVAQRHLELWQQREKRLTQLVGATLLFALLAQWKVVGPLSDDAIEHARLQQLARDGTKELEASNARMKALAPIEATLADVAETIDGEPWRAPTEELKRQYATLRAARDLIRSDPKKVRSILAGDERDRLGAAFVPEVALEANAPPPWIQAAPPNAANRMRLPQDGPEARGERREVERIAAPPEVVAIAQLDLSPELARTADDATYEKELEASFSRRVVALAKDAVTEIEQIVDHQVARPIAEAVRATPVGLLDLAPEQAAVEGLSKRLSDWSKSHAADLSWTDTVDTKRQTMDQLSDVMQKWQQEFTGKLRTRQQAIAGKILDAQTAIAVLQQQDQKLAERQLALKAQVEGLLPDWVKGFVTPAELARTYPLVLAGLACLIAAVALLVRRHFIACRDALYPDGEARRDPALASCFTLVFRGWRGTLWTLATWALLCAAWCWFTGLGLGQATRLWSDGFLGPNPLTERWLAQARWVLLVAPWAVALGLVAVLLDRRRPPARAAT